MQRSLSIRYFVFNEEEEEGGEEEKEESRKRLWGNQHEIKFLGSWRALKS